MASRLDWSNELRELIFNNILKKLNCTRLKLMIIHHQERMN